jgi:hypothetical protein
MFSGSRKKNNENESGIQKTSARGNMDEYEALRTIVAENPGLLMRVLEKIRAARDSNGSQKPSLTPTDKNSNTK